MAAGRFHEGEVALQRTVGLHERMAEVAPRAIRDHLPEQHRDFFPLLPFLLVGSVDAQGQPWASVLVNPPGFVQSPDPTHLAVQAAPLPGDPLVLAPGRPLGILGLQPHTRRRNRVNGTVEAVAGDGFTVAVQQSFGNCPKYIVPREARHAPRRGAVPAVRGPGLDDAGRALIDRTDTLFIATAHPRAADGGEEHQGVDVSHRGGPPGFVFRDAGDTLWLPDYAGNFFFNTLGNLAMNARAGLLVLDPERGHVLQLAVRGAVVTDPAPVSRFPGAQRLVRFEVTGFIRHPSALGLAWG